MNGLHQGHVTQEIKDAMVGHKREGARNDYAITELTIKTAYSEAFKYLTINGYGSQSCKVEELNQKFDAQTKTLMELITELREENKQLKAQLSELTQTQNGIENALKYLGREIGGDKGVENITKMVRSPKGINK
jgi:predicted ribosome quality control (RQC) complex YloA/Tae2 family protein